MNRELRLTERFTNEALTDLLLVFRETHQQCRAAVALYAQRYPDREVSESWVFPKLRDRPKRAGRFDVLPGRKCCSTIVCVLLSYGQIVICLHS